MSGDRVVDSGAEAGVSKRWKCVVVDHTSDSQLSLTPKQVGLISPTLRNLEGLSVLLV